MKYFIHDSNAINDEKITELYINFGYEGVGLFWSILEKISLQEKPVKTLVLKSQLNVGKKLEKCWNFMESIGLIQSNNGETFNEQLLNFSEKYKIKKEKNRDKITEWRKNQQDKKIATSYEIVRNAPKDNISKVKLNKDNISKEKSDTDFEILENYPFDLFWNTYDYEDQKDACIYQWAKTKETDKEKISVHLPEYIRSTPDKAFRLKPINYLYTKAWNNEIVFKINNNGKYDPNQTERLHQEIYADYLAKKSE